MIRLLSFLLVLFVSVVAYGDDAVNLLKPINKSESWRLEKHSGAEATLKIADNTAVIDVTKLASADWHAQAFQTELDLKDGKEYTLKLKLASTSRRSLKVVAMVDQEDYHEIGLHEDVSVEMKDRTFEFTFTANGVVAKKNRIGFVMGDEKGDLIVKEMTLTEKPAKK